MSHHHATRPLRILVALDGTPESSAAIPFALALAGSPAQLVLLQVVPTLEVPLPLSDAVVQYRSSLREHHRHTIEERLQAMAATLRLAHPDVEVEPVVTEGDPPQALRTAATTYEADTIVLATHHARAAEIAALESVATRVALESSIPVMVVRTMPGGGQHQPRPIRRLIVPLDGSPRAAKALPIAIRLASRLAVPLQLVTIIDPQTALPPAFAYGALPTAGALRDELAGLEAEARMALCQAEAVVREAGVNVSTSLLHGGRVARITHLAQPGDVIVMTTRGQREGDAVLFGHMAARLMREAPVPVIVFHPQDAPDLVVGAWPEARDLGRAKT